MRGRGLVTLTVALLLALPAQRALAVTIDDIVIVYGENRIDGAFQCYGVSIYLEGASGITDAVVEQVDTGKKYSLTDGGGGFWGWDNHFTSLATFQNLHPTDTQYHFYFNETTPGNYEDEVIVGYALRPLTVFANITYPLHNATGVPLDPVYTWDNIEGMGWGHGKWVRQGDTKVYAVCPDTDMTKVDWQPGTLSPGTTYTIHVGIL
ncbi:MAG TPA: hypothetical protein VMZ92_11235, partial [Planctomycetota bacterium]|nr:hypothetical protein [Planctomycetota bacterium]